MKRPEVECPKCDGTGKRPISDAHFETLQILKKLKRATPSQVREHFHDKDAIDNSTANARLEFLRSNGLVDREREGKEWHYFPK